MMASFFMRASARRGGIVPSSVRAAMSLSDGRLGAREAAAAQCLVRRLDEPRGLRAAVRAVQRVEAAEDRLGRLAGQLLVRDRLDQRLVGADAALGT